jgi:hypothetical protein
MATFLARFATAAATIQSVPDAVPEPAGVDARGLQAKLTAALSDVRQSPDPDADLLTLFQRYQEARKEMHKVFAERVSSAAEADLVIGRCDAILREIAKIRATTLRGFGAKMDVLRSCECSALEKADPRKSDEVLLQSIAADSYWLFGAGEALVSEETKKDRSLPSTRSDGRAKNDCQKE